MFFFKFIKANANLILIAGLFMVFHFRLKFLFASGPCTYMVSNARKIKCVKYFAIFFRLPPSENMRKLVKSLHFFFISTLVTN